MADLRHGTSSLVDQYGLTVLMLDLSISRVIQETYFQLRPTTQVLSSYQSRFLLPMRSASLCTGFHSEQALPTTTVTVARWRLMDIIKPPTYSLLHLVVGAMPTIHSDSLSERILSNSEHPPLGGHWFSPQLAVLQLFSNCE
ncbi:uncharacterized protein YALI1_A07161g [Yarrowia lipolytica]|uniref:Uncharacterized protein n=1 Tax=Yarrowia lipolytica TaxID=4952 RepID=A0A1D8N413_YARLL|nr:hypothetical protein YALI1_A07161g [Yarrowia lipolytica]